MTTRRWLAVVIVVGAVGYASGRWSARAPDETRHEAATETIAATETQEVTRTEKTHVEAQETQERVIVRERVVYREGPVQVVEREVEAASSTAAAVATAQAREARVEVREVEVVREAERRVEVRTPLPDWRIGGLVGLDLRTGPTYGAEVQRRLWGPVYVEAWGITSGAVGVGLGLEF